MNYIYSFMTNSFQNINKELIKESIFRFALQGKELIE